MDTQPFSIATTEGADGCTRVLVTGELDLVTSETLARRIDELCRPGRHLVVDLAGVTFVDATAARILIERARDARARRCTVTVASPGLPAVVSRLIDVTALDREPPFRLQSLPDEPA